MRIENGEIKVWDSEYIRIYKNTFIWTGPSEEDMTSCMNHEAPGTPQNAGIVAFGGGFHGRTFLALSCTQSNPLHKVDIPASDTVVRVPFPTNRFPLSEHKAHNEELERQCLLDIERSMDSTEKEIVALIVEPIQAEGLCLYLFLYFYIF